MGDGLPPEEDVRTRRVMARLGSTLKEKYRLDGILGVGGMAAVYSATHRNAKRFAVKVLHPELSLLDDLRARFLREGYAANSVGHPGAVSVLDDDVDDDGVAFLVMELLEGSTLDDLQRKLGRHLAVSTVLDVVDQVLDVLAAAHARSIIHRDVKPANVFVTVDGQVKVLDFGVARMRDAAANATRDGLAIGTPAFMAPEQAHGWTDRIDARTDLWSVGAMMFTVLTGRRVHEAGTGQEAMVLAATRPAPPLVSVRPDVPPGVARVVDRALALAREDRWPTAAAMRKAVRDALRDVPRETGEGVALAVLSPSLSPSEHSAVTLADPSTPPPPSSPPPRSPALRRWNRGMTGFGAALAVLGVVTVASTKGQGTTPNAAPPAVPASSAARDVTLLDLPAPQSDSPEALAEYANGMHSLHDGSWERAREAFQRALDKDPMLAAAHLRLAMTSSANLGTVTQTRAELQRAEELRTRLSERDQLFLDALEPTLQRTPLDPAESARRLRRMIESHPNDAELFLWLGYQEVAAPAVALPSFERATEIDPHFADAWEARARALAWLGRLDESREACDTCMPVPTALDSLWWRRRVEVAAGECSASEADARRRIDRDPLGSTGYNDLGDALLALGGRQEAAREAVAQSWRLWPEWDRRRQELVDEASLDVVRGDFLEARGIARRELALDAPDLETPHHLEPIKTLVRIALEMGDANLAGRLADSFAKRADAWTRKERTFEMDDVPWLLHVAFRKGSMTASDYESTRAEWMRTWSGPLRPGSPGYVWVAGYAEATDSEDEAKDALAKLDELGPVPPFFPISTNAELYVGRVYALAGRPAEAEPHLLRAAKHCGRLADPFAHPHAELELGLVQEKLGAKADACDAYEAVLAQWGSTRSRSVTVERAREHARALGCASTSRAQGASH